MSEGEWDLYKVCNLIVQSLASVATVAMAWIAGCELNTAKVARREVDVLQSKATIQEASLSNALERVNLYDDILAAGGGDRFAYNRAYTNLWNDMGSDSITAEHSKVLERMLAYTTRRFKGDATNNDFIARHVVNIPTPFYNAMNVPSNLKSRDHLKRLNALGTIWMLRLNEYIPVVADVAITDPDLYVVQMAVFVLNEVFTDNMIFNVGPRHYFSVSECVLDSESFKNGFEETWKVHKQKILARKPKEVRERPDPPRSNQTYIYDPEMPNSDK